MNNPQAFPSRAYLEHDDTEVPGAPGMFLRDYLAAKAMAAFAMNSLEHIVTPENPDAESLTIYQALARDAYAMADAMLKAREGA